LGGCATSDPSPTTSVGEAWQRPAQAPSNAESPNNAKRIATREGVKRPRVEPDPVATVNGKPISRGRLEDVLLRARGAQVLEQLIVLDAAENAAAERGLTVTEADVEREYNLALTRMTQALSSVAPDAKPDEKAERVLDAVLAERNLSREEFRLGIAANAFLRKLAEADLTISDEDLRAEFDRKHARQVQVRHIQLATQAEVARTREALAQGSDFAELAGKYSANTASAKSGGLLDPFSAEDEQVPALMRQTAFALTPGAVSETIRIGPWYHVLRCEGFRPASEADFRSTKADLHRQLAERRAEAAMPLLHEKLLKQANVQIHDPVLDTEYKSKNAPSRR